MSKHLPKALSAYADLQSAYVKLYSHRIIANSSLPKKKQKFHMKLYYYMTAVVSQRESELNEVVSKLDKDELDLFLQGGVLEKA